jgi:hypothetical protein
VCRGAEVRGDGLRGARGSGGARRVAEGGWRGAEGCEGVQMGCRWVEEGGGPEDL